jgi:hypothetical protein
VFFAVSASLSWLNIVCGVYLVQVSLLLIGQQGLGNFVSALASHWLEDCANSTAMQITAPTTLSAIQAAS